MENFKRDVQQGLCKENKTLSCKYIYDENGSRLFQQIMDMPEYYLTDCEAEILTYNGDYFKKLFSSEYLSLVELGAGDGKKTVILLEHLLKAHIDFEYHPIDISNSAIDDLVGRLQSSYSDLKVSGLCAEYFEGLRHLSCIESCHKVVLFLGSNIGNMTAEQADIFLTHLYESIDEGDYLLIGFDLRKCKETIVNAYDDNHGITERFNKNLLHRINKELGGTFSVDDFTFYCEYDDNHNAVKSYLISEKDHDVYIESIDENISFKKGEPIHTESSHKYSIDCIENMAGRAGFSVIDHLYDSRKYYVDSLWQK